MSFREMRRFRQQLSQEECEAVLHRRTSGVLAVTGDNSWPYAVPLSYVYQDGAVFFHCAKAGHKLDALRREPRASFCVIDQDKVIPEKYTTVYRSVVVFGRMFILEDEAELRRGVEALAQKYYPQGTPEELEAEISGSLGHMVILKMDISHMTGKESRELTEARNK